MNGKDIDDLLKMVCSLKTLQKVTSNITRSIPARELYKLGLSVDRSNKLLLITPSGVKDCSGALLKDGFLTYVDIDPLRESAPVISPFEMDFSRQTLNTKSHSVRMFDLSCVVNGVLYRLPKIGVEPEVNNSIELEDFFSVLDNYSKSIHSTQEKLLDTENVLREWQNTACYKVFVIIKRTKEFLLKIDAHLGEFQKSMRDGSFLESKWIA